MIILLMQGYCVFWVFFSGFAIIALLSGTGDSPLRWFVVLTYLVQLPVILLMLAWSLAQWGVF